MKQAFFKFKNGKLVILNKKEKLLFDKVVDFHQGEEDAGVGEEVYVSFRQEHKEKEMSVSLWADQFAVSFKYSELIALLKTMENIDEIKALIAAEGI